MTTPIEGEWVQEGPQPELIPAMQAWEEVGGLPVRITNQPSQRESAEFGAFMTYPLPIAPNGPVQLCQRRLRRFKARLAANLEFGMLGVVLSNRIEPLTGPNPQGYLAVCPATSPNGTTAFSVHGAIAAATAGSIQMPPGDGLSTFTISLSTVGTANMTITTSNVANVTNGPLTWTLLAGQQSLTVNFPQPLLPKSITPITISWTATAAAVGDIDAQGPSGFIPTFDLPEWESQQPLYAVGLSSFEFQANPQSTISVLDQTYGDIRID